MKKILLVLAMFSCVLAFCQKKYTVEQAEKSNDPQVIAAFVKDNPTHPKVPLLKRRLVTIMNNGIPNSSAAKPRVKPLNKEKLANSVKRDVADGTNDRNKKTADLLTHIFDNDPNRKDVYINILNRSKCNLILKISGGKKFYNLNVPANNSNFILIPKGSYTLTTMVCDAKYTSVKKFEKDTEISLNSKGGK